MLDALGTTRSTQQTLQLQDCWGNTWTPAAAQLAARLPAAALDSDLSPQGAQQGAAGQQQGGGGSAVDDDWANKGIVARLEMLAAALQADQVQQQQQQEQQEAPEPRSKRQRTAAIGSFAGAPASAAAAGNGGAAGGMDGSQQQWSLHLLLLRALDAPDAAGSSNPAAAGGRCIQSLPFAADGSCVVPAMLLSELGIDSVGEWHLWAQAVCGSSSSSSSSSGAGVTAASAAAGLRVQLGSWHIVLQSTREVKEAEVRVKLRVKALNEAVRLADTEVGEKEASLQGQAQKVREAEAAARNAERDVRQREQNVNEPRSRPLVQLQAAAGEDGRQQQLLGDAGRRGMMLERPWVFSRDAGGATNRPCTDDEVGVGGRITR
jgi:hypothetical protein